jgi:hypothetical protein
MQRRWGVGTWGYGERGDGSLPDGTSSVVDMVQHGNLAGLVGGIDHNTLFRPDMGQLGGSAQPAPAQRPEIPRMYIAVGRTIDQVSHARLVTGGRVLRRFDGPEGGYGIPQDALDWKSGAGREAVPFVFVEAGELFQLDQPWPPAPGEPAPVDLSGVRSALTTAASALDAAVAALPA